MRNVLMVGLGGLVGSVLRYGLAGAVGRWKGASGFPLETLVVNVLGCLVIGFLAGFGDARGGLSDEVRALLLTGLLGGFTTFSAFGLETFRLIREGQWPFAAASVALQLVVGLGSVWAGYAMARIAA